MVGSRLREARTAQQRSLSDVAGAANISIATLSRMETGKQSVAVEDLVSLALVLGIPARDFLQPDAEESAVDPLALRIAALGSPDRAALWRDLASARRDGHGSRRKPTGQDISEQIDELLAQFELLREELASLRRRIPASRRGVSDASRRQRG